MKETSSSLLCIAKDGVYENPKLGIQPRSLKVGIFYICQWDSFWHLIRTQWIWFQSVGDLIHHFSCKRNIYCVTQWAGLILQLTVPSQLSNSYTFSGFWHFHLCDSGWKGTVGPRFNLKPVYWNKQMLREPLIWISERRDGGIWKNTEIFSRDATSQENSLWWGEEGSGKGALVY